MTVKGITQAELARALGLSQPAITKLKGQGMPVESVEAARAWRMARLNIAQRKPEAQPVAGPAPTMAPLPTMPPMPPGQAEGYGGAAWAGESHDSARTRLRISEANLAELREAEERRELIRVDAVRSALAGVLSTTRDGLMQIPSRLASVLAAESDPAVVRATLSAELQQCLAQLTAAPAKLGEEGAAA